MSSAVFQPGKSKTQPALPKQQARAANPASIHVFCISVWCIYCISGALHFLFFCIFVFLCVVHFSFFCFFVFFVFFVFLYFSYFCKVMHLMRVLQWLCRFLYFPFFWCSIFRIFDEFFVFSFPGLMHQVHASRSTHGASDRGGGGAPSPQSMEVVTPIQWR